MDDGRIVDLYFERSEDAITETRNKYGRYCRKIAYNILRSEEDAEECENDTYLKAWNAIPPTRPARLSLFLGTITRNTALDRYIRERAVKRRPSAETVIDELSECIADPEAGAFSDSWELSEALNCFLSGLPKKTRIVFVRRYWFMDEIPDIAKDCGMTVSNVKVTLMRTRQKLRSYLEREGIQI